MITLLWILAALNAFFMIVNPNFVSGRFNAFACGVCVTRAVCMMYPEALPL